MISLRYFFSFLFFSIFLNIICLQTVSAFTVSPALKKLYVKPGDQLVETITVINEQNTKIVLRPLVENFKPKDTKGTPEFLGDNDVEGAARWIQIPFKSIELRPGERKDFIFKINIPRSTTPGWHYAALFWSEKSI